MKKYVPLLEEFVENLYNAKIDPNFGEFGSNSSYFKNKLNRESFYKEKGIPYKDSFDKGMDVPLDHAAEYDRYSVSCTGIKDNSESLIHEGDVFELSLNNESEEEDSSSVYEGTLTSDDERQYDCKISLISLEKLKEGLDVLIKVYDVSSDKWINVNIKRNDNIEEKKENLNMKKIPNFYEFTNINECKDDRNVQLSMNSLADALINYVQRTANDFNELKLASEVSEIVQSFIEGENLSDCLRRLADVVENIK